MELSLIHIYPAHGQREPAGAHVLHQGLCALYEGGRGEYRQCGFHTGNLPQYRFRGCLLYTSILEIEKYLDGEIGEIPLARKENIGRTVDFAAGRNRYIGYLISIATRSFKNMKVALDCANGSASAIAKNVFDALGAETHVMNNDPNGLNINTDCGSTHIRYLQNFVVEQGCDLGFAYDGDADRCKMCIRDRLDGPDFELAGRLAGDLPIPVIGEGRVHTPEEAVHMLDMGVWAVIVGGAITRPLEIAQRFMSCLLYTSPSGQGHGPLTTIPM